MAATVMFMLKCTSRNAFNHKSKDVQFRNNYKRMFGLSLPHMDSVNDLFEKMDTSEFETFRCRLISGLIEKRIFHKFRFFDRYFCIAIDATGIYNRGETPPQDIKEHASFKKSKKPDSEKIYYFSFVLEAVMICSNGMTVPLMSEWIDNGGKEYSKQDCELEAFKRLSVRLKDCFPGLPVCILADGLYSNIVLMDICQKYGWQFIVVFKDGNLPGVWQEVESLLPLQKNSACEEVSCDATHWYTHQYQLVKDIEYQKHKIQWIMCKKESSHRETGKSETNCFVFLTGMEVELQNVASLIKGGRARWNIEDRFNTQKNRGGELHHKFNRINFNALKMWHSIRQFACLILELVEYTGEIRKLMDENSKKMTVKEIWENLNSFLTMCPVDELMVEFEDWSKSRRQVRLE